MDFAQRATLTRLLDRELAAGEALLADAKLDLRRYEGLVKEDSIAAQQLDTLPQLGRDYVRAQIFIEQSLVPRWPEVNIVDLQEAWADVIKRGNIRVE